LKLAQKALRWSAVFGVLALVGSLFTAFSDGLSWNAVGAASIIVLTFAVTVVVSAIALATGPLGGLVLGGLATVMINEWAGRLSRTLFP